MKASFLKFLASFFIVLNLFAMIRVHLPLETEFFSVLYYPIDKYLSFFSIYQDWMMFARNPSRKEFYLTAEIEFLDNTKFSYHFPRGKNLSLFEKYSYGEKFRKFISDSASHHRYQFLLNDIARFALRKVSRKVQHKIPSRVHLIRFESSIPHISSRFLNHFSYRKINAKKNIFTYEVMNAQL